MNQLFSTYDVKVLTGCTLLTCMAVFTFGHFITISGSNAIFIYFIWNWNFCWNKIRILSSCQAHV